MLVYILKSAACLAILFVFYKLFLEKENMHKFKRFYLLGALVFSLLVPALVFTEYVEATPVGEIASPVIHQPQASDGVINVPAALEADVIDIAPLLWGIYFFGLIFFGLKFFRNLFQIFKRIRRNPKHKLARFTQVLLQEKITPHTFFSYIFLNRTKFESKEIPKEVLLHEETHAQQKHSWDVVFVEILQVIFWVNPFIYLAKKAIKLNHEFLADQAVLQKNIDETTYKNTLLSYLSPDSEQKYQPLANAINYSSTRLTVFGKTFTFGSAVGQVKKRFTIMKTHTTKKTIFFRSFLLLPLLAILLYGFSETRIEQAKVTSHNSTIINDLNIEIDSNGDLRINNRIVLLSDILKEVTLANPSLEPKYLRNYVTANILYDESQAALIEVVQSELYQAGISNVEHTSRRTSSILERDGFKSSIYNGKSLDEAKALRRDKVLNQKNNALSNDETILEIVWIEIKNENEIWFNDELTTLGALAKKVTFEHQTSVDEKNLEVQIYSTGIIHSDFVDEITIEVRKAGAKRVHVMTEEYIMHESEYKDEIEITPETTILKAHKMTFEEVSSQVGATKKQIEEYNALAKKYYGRSRGNMVSMESLKRKSYLFNLMSEKQKAEAEPFLDIPPMPTSKYSQDGASRKLIFEYDKLAKHYNKMPRNKMKILKKDVDRLEHIYSLMSEKQKADAEPFPDFPEPPTPPKAPKGSKVKKGEKNNISTPSNPPNLSDIEYAEKVIEETIANQDPYDHSNLKYTIINGKVAKVPSFPYRPRGFKAKNDISPPPAPPEPVSPLDHVIDMAKKNAIFYLEGKEITSDEAIEIMKTNKDMNVDSRGSSGKRPVVKMSIKPISINE